MLQKKKTANRCHNEAGSRPLPPDGHAILSHSPSGDKREGRTPPRLTTEGNEDALTPAPGCRGPPPEPHHTSAKWQSLSPGSLHRSTTSLHTVSGVTGTSVKCCSLLLRYTVRNIWKQRETQQLPVLSTPVVVTCCPPERPVPKRSQHGGALARAGGGHLDAPRPPSKACRALREGRSSHASPHGRPSKSFSDILLM